MMKLLVALALAIATASAFSPQFEQRDLKYRVQQAKLKLAEATSRINSQLNVPHNALRLMNNGTEEDMCDSPMLQMSTVPKCEAELLKQFQQDSPGTQIPQQARDSLKETCRCTLVPMIGAIGPMLNLMCGQDECAVLMRSLSEEESGSSHSDSFDYDTMCTKKHCFREIFDMTQNLGQGMSAPAGCPALPTMAPSESNDDMEEGMAAMMEGIDFYCAKNIQGEYCGKAFETAGQTVEADCGAFNSSCVCPYIASQGCCMKLAYDFTLKHEPSAAAEMQTALSACQYDVTKMVTCANSKKRRMKFVKQKIAFKKVKCGKKKSEVALIVQQMVASKAQVNVGNVAVAVDSCPCCSDGASRRLLSTGDVETTVTITGDNVDTAATKINQATETGSWASNDLGDSVEVNQAATTEARVETQSSDIGQATDSPASAIVPSVLVALLMAVIAALF